MFGMSSVIYPELTLDDMLLANAVVLVLGFLASLSPAWRASRYQPVEAITNSAACQDGGSFSPGACPRQSAQGQRCRRYEPR